MKRDEELVVGISDFATGGQSLARIDGLVVFVPGTVPGDTVKVRVRRVKKNYLEAEQLGLLKASPLRTEPRCSHFGLCGGCKWQQASYEAQLDFKRRQVVDALERIGGFRGVSVAGAIGSDDRYFYRNKMEFSFGPKWVSREKFRSRGEPGPEELALGLHPAGLFSKVLDVDECFLQSPLSNRILQLVRRFALEKNLSFYSTLTHTGYLRHLVIREGKRTGDVMVNLVTSEERGDLMGELGDRLRAAVPEVGTFVNNITTRKSQVAIGEHEYVCFGPGFITEKLGGRKFRISANSFFQTNTSQAERLYEAAVRMAGLRSDDVVYDLYCGTGTITLFLAGHVSRVIGVEAVGAAVLDARSNAELNRVSNCFFEVGDLKEKLNADRQWMERHGLPTVVILDPPRSGAHGKVIQRILELHPERIVYVSCNPATQARDLKLLCADGSYFITGVQPVDMFPHTEHIECVVSLRRNTG
jgi:23S rRNA (uracil1939-C5)-methyltransferase